MNKAAAHIRKQAIVPPNAAQGFLRRKCDCGNPTAIGGACAECGKKKQLLQRKLSIAASNDPLEAEADRIADLVSAAPDYPTATVTAPRIQRNADQALGLSGSTAPHSVERVLASPGSPLESLVQQGMGQRFGHDFSQVRVHSDAAAEHSAREINAKAYTVGHNIVFNTGQFAPYTSRGRRLLAHELTHVVQQSDSVGNRLEHSDENRIANSIIPPALRIGQNVQRDAAEAGESKGASMEDVAGSLWAKDAEGKLLPPSLDDISQGGLADCFLFAAMAAIVNTNPQQIVDMIRDNGNGTYTVTFKGIGFFSSARQTVSAKFPVGMHGNVTSRKALWPIIIEKAYAQEKGGVDKLGKGGNSGTALDDMLDDGPSRFDPREKTSDYIMGKLAVVNKKKWPMTINAPKKDGATKEKKAMADGTPGLHFWHSYAIVDVDSLKNRIKLFNPWGHDHPNGDGWIEVAQASKFFIEIAIND